jgi:hypothetical protein
LYKTLSLDLTSPAPEVAEYIAIKGESGQNGCFNLLSGHRQRDRLPPSCHDAAPRSINHKRGIRQQITRSMISFMESIV